MDPEEEDEGLPIVYGERGPGTFEVQGLLQVLANNTFCDFFTAPDRQVLPNSNDVLRFANLFTHHLNNFVRNVRDEEFVPLESLLEELSFDVAETCKQQDSFTTFFVYFMELLNYAHAYKDRACPREWKIGNYGFLPSFISDYAGVKLLRITKCEQCGDLHGTEIPSVWYLSVETPQIGGAPLNYELSELIRDQYLIKKKYFGQCIKCTAANRYKDLSLTTHFKLRRAPKMLTIHLRKRNQNKVNFTIKNFDLTEFIHEAPAETSRVRFVYDLCAAVKNKGTTTIDGDRHLRLIKKRGTNQWFEVLGTTLTERKKQPLLHAHTWNASANSELLVYELR